jgi:WhiB family redox-sensing transcriptional regulator
MMIRQHKDEIHADEGNAARTGVVVLIPTGSSLLDPGKNAGQREERTGQGRADRGEHKGGRAQMGMIADWPSVAACRTGDPDALFVQGAEQNVAKRICRSCPVRYECLADALDNRIEFGVWGGMTERERRALLRRHPQVPSWRKMFEAALNKSQDQELVPAG